MSRTALGDEVLALAADGVPLGLSVGFAPVANRGAEMRGRVTRTRAVVDHVAVVRAPAYPTARVAAVRSAEALGESYETASETPEVMYRRTAPPKRDRP